MIGSIYDYYLSTYNNSIPAKNQTHKKSELKNIYNNIVKISKSSPLYKVEVSSAIQKFAIDIKENARSLSNDINNLELDDIENIKSTYSSDNEDLISVKTLNPDEAGDDNFTFTVENLAKPQVNTGNYLKDDSLSMTKGDHTFEVSIDDSTYEFQFKVNDNDTNRSVIEKLSRLVNRSGIGLNSSVLHLGGNSALEISSDSTGVGLNPVKFTINNSSTNASDDVVDRLGIANVSAYPENAKFTVNGMERSSTGNTFTINNSFEITLNKTSEDSETASITKKDNLDSVIDSVKNLLDSYNKLASVNKDSSNDSGTKELAISKQNMNPYFGKDFVNVNSEMIKTANSYKNDLESIGITMDEAGKLNLDESLFTQVVSEDSISGALDKLNDFKHSLSSKSYDMSINPMKYVDKTMISYPNPIKGKNFANPYMTSIYTGMMFNGYV